MKELKTGDIVGWYHIPNSFKSKPFKAYGKILEFGVRKVKTKRCKLHTGFAKIDVQLGNRRTNQYWDRINRRVTWIKTDKLKKINCPYCGKGGKTC